MLALCIPKASKGWKVGKGAWTALTDARVPVGGKSFHAKGLEHRESGSYIAGWEEECSGPPGKSFRFVRACVRAVIVKWK